MLFPGTDTAGAGLSLSPEEAKLQQEGFPALVSMSLRLPKVQCVHGQRQLLAGLSWEQTDVSDVHRQHRDLLSQAGVKVGKKV